MKVYIVIPAYEPDDALVQLCEHLKGQGLNDILIVDDGSGNGYTHIFEKVSKEFGCEVLKHAVNMGKGRALKNAFNYLLNLDEDIIGCVTCDSDGQHSVSDIKKCIDMLIKHPNSFILGCRDFLQDNVPFKSRHGNLITRNICKYLCGIDVSDTQTGLRGISRAFMEDLLNVSGERFEFETNMLIAAKDKYEFLEVKIETIYDSKEDHKTHFDPIKDSIKIYKIFGIIFFKYIISSLSSSIIDILLFSVLCSSLIIWDENWYIIVATIIARIVSSIYNYLVNHKVVFKSNKKLHTSAGKYFALVIVQMILSALLVTVGVKGIVFVPEAIIKVIVDTGLFFLSYYIQRKYIF